MKKHFSFGLISGLLIGLFLGSAAIAIAATPLKLIINGEDITASAQPVIIDGRTLVPARAVAEKLGAEVIWDGVNNTIVINSLSSPNIPLKEESSADWISARDLIDNYPAITDLYAGDWFEIGGKTRLLISDLRYQDISEGEHAFDSNLGVLKIKIENYRCYFSISNLKSLGVL